MSRFRGSPLWNGLVADTVPNAGSRSELQEPLDLNLPQRDPGTLCHIKISNMYHSVIQLIATLRCFWVQVQVTEVVLRRKSANR